MPWPRLRGHALDFTCSREREHGTPVTQIQGWGVHHAVPSTSGDTLSGRRVFLVGPDPGCCCPEYARLPRRADRAGAMLSPVRTRPAAVPLPRLPPAVVADRACRRPARGRRAAANARWKPVPAVPPGAQVAGVLEPADGGQRSPALPDAPLPDEPYLLSPVPAAPPAPSPGQPAPEKVPTPKSPPAPIPDRTAAPAAADHRWLASGAGQDGRTGQRHPSWVFRPVSHQQEVGSRQ